ncbi:MAG: hypothetical protein NZM00_13055 [Anaerolinea sp.]|nr:hypothetical protein [Anaerolinea sp.]
MDLQFYEGDGSEYVPRPPEEVRILEVEHAVYPDRFRVYVHVRVTPFQVRPNLLIAVRADDGRVISELSVIETMHNDMEFTVHLRGLNDPAGAYTLLVDLFYETRNPPLDRREVPFVVPEAEDGSA